MPFEIKEMDFGTIIDRGLKLFKNNFVPLVLIMAILYGPFLFTMQYSMELTTKSIQKSSTLADIGQKIMSGNMPDLNDLGLASEDIPLEKIGIYLALSLFLLLLAPLSYLSIFHVLSENIQGRSPTVGQAISFGARRYWILFGALILTSIILGLAIGILSTLTCIAMPIGCLTVPVAVLIATFSGLFIAFLPCVVAMENIGSSKSISRTLGLLKGYWWRSMGIYVMVSVGMSVVVTIFSSIGQIIGKFLPENIGIVYNSAISTLFSVIFQPIIWTVLFLMYIDIRIRKEHLDLDILATRTYKSPKPTPDEPTLKENKDDVWS